MLKPQHTWFATAPGRIVRYSRKYAQILHLGHPVVRRACPTMAPGANSWPPSYAKQRMNGARRRNRLLS
jgi:hypothetical protein